MHRPATILAGLCAAALLGWLAFTRLDGAGATVEDKPAAPPAVPVVAGLAEARDMPVYVRGIGSVQAFNSVAVRSRVDGQIVRVAFTEGQNVKAGDLLFEIDPAPFRAVLAQASAAKERDQAQLAGAMADLKRTSALLERGFQTRQLYDQQKAQVDQFNAALKSDEAQIAAAQLNLNYAEIRSPIDGRSGARNVDIGNLVRATDSAPLTTVTQIHPIFVSFTVPQKEFEKIRAAQAKDAIATEVFAEGTDKPIAVGKLAFIDNQIDQQTGTLRLKASFDNADETLWPGQFVAVRLTVDTLKDAVTVPARAVQRGPDGGAYLFALRADETAEMRKVRVVEVEDDRAVIDQGLAAGERIVVDGQYRLDNGSRVSEAPRQAAAGS